jgi:D-alanyl-D-alanine carboxypeptidase
MRTAWRRRRNARRAWRRQTRWLVLTLLVAVAASSCGEDEGGRTTSTQEPAAAQRQERPPAAGRRADLELALAQALDRARDEVGAPGAAAAVVLPSGEVWTGASGLREAGRRDRVDAQTAFAVGSITKTFVAALVLDLARERVLQLDDPVAQWVPRFPNARRITLRHLLQHTAGTRNFTDHPGFSRAIGRDSGRWTPQRVLRYARPPVAAPGRSFRYSNTNYVLLGLVVQRATGRSVAHELHRRLLPSSAYPSMALQGDERPRAPLARGHEDRDGDGSAERLPRHRYIPTTPDATAAWSAGGMVASAGDLARAGHALLADGLLPPAQRRRMLPASDEPGSYGLGVAYELIAGYDAFGHIGELPGFTADLWHLPELRVTVAAMQNRYEPGDHRIARALVDTLADALTTDRPPIG